MRSYRVSRESRPTARLLPSLLLWCVAGFVTVGLAGCGSIRAANARSNVARLHGCASTEVEDLGRRRLLARGCGRQHVFYCAAQWVACADMHELVRERSSLLLRCERRNVRVRELEPALFLSRGCDRQVVQRCALTREGTAHCRVDVAPVRAGYVR